MKHLLKSASLALLLLFGVTTMAQADGDGDYLYFKGTFSPAGTARLPFKTFTSSINTDSGYFSGYLSGTSGGKSVGAYFSGRMNERGVITGGGFYYGGKYYTLSGTFNRATKTVVIQVKDSRTKRPAGVMVGKAYVLTRKTLLVG